MRTLTDEIKRLRKRFKKLDLDSSALWRQELFTSIPELQKNPLVQRVIVRADTDGDGQVDFQEFILGTSQFSVGGDEEQKLRFAFSIYDMDKVFPFQRGALPGALKMMVGDRKSERQQLQQLVDKTIILLDKDGDRKISFQEFSAVVKPGGPQALGDHCVSFIRSPLNNSFFFLLYLTQRSCPRGPVTAISDLLESVSLTEARSSSL